MERMQRRGVTKMTALSYDSESPSQQHHTFETVQGVRQLTRKIADTLTGILPRSSRPRIAAGDAVTQTNLAPLKILHLLACVHRTQRSKYLVQARIEMVEIDREPFYLIRRQLNQLRNLTWSLLHLRTITGIHFTKLSQSARIVQWFDSHSHSSVCA